MLNKSARKINPFFLHYFLFYATFTACFAFFSCNGVRSELIPKRNTVWTGVSEKGKGNYLKLLQMNDKTGQEKIYKAISNIKTADALESFIKKNIENQTNYNKLLKLLPQSERRSFQKDFDQADLDTQAKLINQNEKLLQQIQLISIECQQHYIDLLQIESNEKIATKLKKDILNATKPEEINQLITSILPNPLQQLNDDAKASLSQLPDHDRQEILKSIHCNSQKGRVASDDLGALIKQKEQAQAKKDKAVPADDWGSKLSLEGKQRKQFLFSIMEFSASDQNSLKDLFDKVDPDSISNFLSVYYSGFNTKERIELLSTIIYLYKGWPNLTIKLCNTPSSLSWLDKLGLFQKTQKHQLKLLTKLDELLQE
ncbi:hypothetical protein ACRRVD_01510 [Candidatus Cardinium hertigii]|uniref:hypothetical protein n=1 Tax=Candidatus Cardinium hertigii TaxID=247481 RepID=UPI003D7E1CD8